MKKIYWRPNKISNTALTLIAIFSLSSLFMTERIQIQVKQAYHHQKLAASKLALEAFQHIKQERLRRGMRIDPELDATRSGLIGELMSSITSNTGHLYSKQTTINPNFAAVVVDLLKQAGVNEGDVVAVGMSGSFPAINICVYAAIQTLRLNPIIISSASSSQWGANDQRFSWLEMDRFLFQKNIFKFRSLAASIGGIEDRGLGISKSGKRLLMDTIERQGISFIDPENFSQSILKRMETYNQLAGDEPIKAYVNVGGGTISVGREEGKLLFKPGLNKKMPFGTGVIDSVMTSFARQDTPVIHFINIIRLAKKYGLPLAPTIMPSVGEGDIYMRRQYNPWLAAVSLLLILTSLYAFIRSDLGYRLLQPMQKHRKQSSRPEQMV